MWEAASEVYRPWEEYDRLKEKRPRQGRPMLVPLMISNMAAGNVSIAYGLKGKSLNVVDCLCNRYTFHRRSISYNPVR